jgi:SAM-dependent methyltransferase
MAGEGPAPPAAARIGWRLFLVGLAALYWELALIRWLGSCVRVIAYYSNFVLIAAFFGLGTGALLGTRRIKLHRLVVPVLCVPLLLGLYFGRFFHANPGSADEYVWIGAAGGVVLSNPATTGTAGMISLTLILTVVYVAIAAVFVVFGQWIARLFAGQPPLWAYSVEVVGSLAGILCFALMSYLGAAPPVWFVVGFLVLLPLLERRPVDYLVAVLCAGAVLWAVTPFSGRYLWSPYYKIELEPLTGVVDRTTKAFTTFEAPVGHALTVNNDYHQLMLDLRVREREHAFVTSWRTAYDYPYRQAGRLPPGPILVVGAGTGNDVSAALRNTDRQVYAVEIDPVIARLGREMHGERPYQNPRVHMVIDDARSFFQRTDERFALVVFGFLDSHTLLSSFSSLRLDNFVYTRESFEQVKRLLLPGGRVEVTFATNRPWLHERFVRLLDTVFDYDTVVAGDLQGYANGIVYSNGRSAGGPAPVRRDPGPRSKMPVPTDDWPFLYLRQATLPGHYIIFAVVALAFAPLSLLLLPRGQRQVRLPYFFLGAAFFLIETSNVVRLSLLCGSTWYVNTIVFAGILTLVLLGNLTASVWRQPRLDLVFLCLAVGVAVGHVVPSSWLLSIDSLWLRIGVAVVLYLAPVYFAALVFAMVIRDEPQLGQAYGSNILGAVTGGVCEYLSLVFGLKFLNALILVFYLVVFLLLRRAPSRAADVSVPGAVPT